MKKTLAVAATLAGLGVLGGILISKARKLDWETMFASMPEDAPPKWMFRNITAIRQNTDRILESLNAGQPADTTPVAGSDRR